jgi:sulfur relay (sulfurtransferase) DsrC/TusE family protein
MDRARGSEPGAPHGTVTPSDWTPESADAAARAAGLERLGDRHWRVITRCREEAARTGRWVPLARIVELTGLDEADLGILFPGRPEASIARIAGLPAPGRPEPERGAARH